MALPTGRPSISVTWGCSMGNAGTAIVGVSQTSRVVRNSRTRCHWRLRRSSPSAISRGDNARPCSVFSTRPGCSHGAVLGELVRVAGDHQEAAGEADDLRHVADVGARGLDPGAERAEDADRALDDLAHLLRDEHEAVEVGRPGDPPAAYGGPLHGPREFAGVHVVGERGAIVGTRHHREHQRGVGHGPRHRPLDRVAVPRQDRGMARDEARRGTEAHHTAEGRRPAQRATEVGALGQRAHAGGQRGGRASAGAAGGAVEVPRVARGAEDGIDRVRTEGELRRVRLADDDGAGRPEPLDDQRVLVGDVALEELRAIRRPQPARGRDVLDAHRHAEQRRQRGVSLQRGRGAPGLPQGRVPCERDDGVHLWIDGIDAAEHRLHDFQGRGLACAVEPEQLGGRREGQIARDGGHVSGARPPAPW